MNSRAGPQGGWQRSRRAGPGAGGSAGRRRKVLSVADRWRGTAAHQRLRGDHGTGLPDRRTRRVHPGPRHDELKFAGPESRAELFGLFQVSIIHNIVHLLFAVGLLAAARAAWSRAYLLGGGIGYLGVVVYGVLVDHESDANFLPLNDADNLLHVGLALVMIVLGIVGTRLPRGRT